MKNNTIAKKYIHQRKYFSKVFMVMKITLFLLFISFSSVFAKSSYSQNTKLSLRLENVSLQQVFEEIQKNSEFIIFYKDNQVDPSHVTNVNIENATVDQILDQAFKGTDLGYKIIDRQIVVSKEKIEGKPSVTKTESTTAQKKEVSGLVKDSKGVPLPGVTIMIKGTTIGVITDKDGNFTISVPADAKTISFSFVGMKKKEILIGDKSVINIVMEDEMVDMSEIVVVGYGTQKKRDVIGSVSTIKADVINTPSNATNFASLIQGQAAGVSVQSLSGRPGAEVDIKIRGLSSISAGTSPLWIIDGVPVYSAIDINNNKSAAQSPMSLINQSDIESIQILKDAAATSIYGSRGSNGVIMVTTKSGIGGKPSLNVDYSTGISNLPPQNFGFANTTQWLKIHDEAKTAYGLGAYTMSDFYSKRVYATEFLTRAQAEAINTDWLKATMRQGNYQDINISANGGDKDKTVRYYFSGIYRKDNSVMNNEDLERYGLRANLDLNPIKSLELGTKINLSLSQGNRGKNDRIGVEDGNKNGTGGGFGFVNSAVVPLEPVYSVANPSLYYNPLAGNPVATSDPANMIEKLDIYRVLASVYGEYHVPFISGLSIRSEASIDFIQANRNMWVSSLIRKNGSMDQDNATTSKSLNYNAFLKYHKVFGEHILDLTAGTESQRGNSWFRSMQGENLVGVFQELGTPTLINSIFSGIDGESRLRSYFGRANYKYKDKYLLGVSMRRDGSSVFTPDFRWGNFYAFSAGWIVFDNPNFLKLRGSFGQTGNASIPGNLDKSNYATGLSYGGTDVSAVNGTRITSIGVTNLRWESTNNSDIGLDFGFLNHRIDGSVAYYNKYVRGLLLASSLPPSAGISSIYGNIGDLVNSGVEFSVTSSNLNPGKFKWQTTLNVAFNHNEVKKLTPQVDQSGTGMVSNPYITKVGYGIREYYLADFAGVDPQTGLPQIYARDQALYAKTGQTSRLKDAQGKDVLLLATSSNNNSNPFHIKGKSQQPKYYGGLTNTFMYKGFDLSILITFSGGNYIYDQARKNMADPNSNGQILADFDQNYWKKPGDIAKYARLDYKGNIKMADGSIVGLGNTNGTYTSQFLFKGDYVKLKSINFGYTIPKSTGKNLFQSFRIYATVENLKTFTDFPGWDPEGQRYIDLYDLPQLFSASLGVSIKF